MVQGQRLVVAEQCIDPLAQLPDLNGSPGAGMGMSI
jgi:hypothetical protein